MAYIRRGLSTEGNLRFKINWANLILGRKFTSFLCFTLYLRAIFQVQAPGGGLILFWRGLFSKFYGTYNNLNKNSDHDDGGYKIRFCPSFTFRKKIQDT